MRWRPALLFAALIALAGTLSPLAAVADTGITISPYLQQVQIGPTDVSKNFTVEVTNHTSQTRSFEASAVDFGSLDESGGVAFSGNSGSEIGDMHKLAAWMSLDKQTLTLAPEQKQVITATIHNDTTLAPGGHYGAVIVTSRNPAAKSDVAVNETVSALVFATKTGGEQYGIAINPFTWSHGLLRLPTEVTLPIHNTGNTHAVPRGIVTLIGPRGQEISRGIINNGSTILLPDTTRSYPVDLTTLAKPTWPGTYRLRIQYRYDGTETFQTTEVKTLYLGKWLYAGFVLLVAFTAMVLVGVRQLKKRKRKSLKPQPPSQ